MPRPFTRAQALENMAFLAALRVSGNARDAARTLGAHRAKFTKRRAKDPAFAAEWDAALACAHAALKSATAHPPSEAEPQIIRTRSGRLQLRQPRTRRLDRAAEQAFLSALGATANVRLSAAAAGFSHSAFYARRRESVAFKREMRLALERGYERIEMALLSSFDPASYRDDLWRNNEPPPLPQMTVDEALQLLRLHQKQVIHHEERPDFFKRRRGESPDARSERLARRWRAERAREAEDAAVTAAAAAAARSRPRAEPPAPVLPALDQVRESRIRR